MPTPITMFSYAMHMTYEIVFKDTTLYFTLTYLYYHSLFGLLRSFFPIIFSIVKIKKFGKKKPHIKRSKNEFECIRLFC